MDNITVKAAEEKWHLTSLKSKQQADKLVSEFNELGVLGTEKYITGKNRVGFTFCRWNCTHRLFFSKHIYVGAVLTFGCLGVLKIIDFFPGRFCHSRKCTL